MASAAPVGGRPALKERGSPVRWDNGRWRVPGLHEDALLRIDAPDVGRADDAAGPAGGERRARLISAKRRLAA
jgi:hypothetical protein